jgi:hypothetical protein
LSNWGRPTFRPMQCNTKIWFNSWILI